jgi:hypothetical protein
LNYPRPIFESNSTLPSHSSEYMLPVYILGRRHSCSDLLPTIRGKYIHILRWDGTFNEGEKSQCEILTVSLGIPRNRSTRDQPERPQTDPFPEAIQSKRQKFVFITADCRSWGSLLRDYVLIIHLFMMQDAELLLIRLWHFWWIPVVSILRWLVLVFSYLWYYI